MYKINVLVICYKQEDTIGRALDSVLSQKEYGLNKIVIQDDCSPDSTWQIIQEYKRKYPEIIVANRNEHNMGIYANFERLTSNSGEADLYIDLSGDDTISQGWFNEVQAYIRENNIDINQAITFLGKYSIIKPNGLNKVNSSNKLVENEKDVVSLKIRGLVSARSTLTTKKTRERYQPIILNEGLGLAEAMADLRPFVHADKFYYIPFVGSCYFAGIGVSTKLGGEKYFRERIHYYERAKQLYHLNNKATAWMDFLISRRKYEISPSFKEYISLFIPFIKSQDKYSYNNLISNMLMFFRLFRKLFQSKDRALKEM